MDFLFQVFECAYRDCPREERSQAGFCGAKLSLIHSSHNWWRRIRCRKIRQKKIRFDHHRLCWQSRRQTLAGRHFSRCRPDNNRVPLFQKRVVQNLFRKFHNDIHKSAFIRSLSDSPFLLKRRCFLLPWNGIFLIKSCTALTEKGIIIIICKINLQWQMIPGTVVLF